MGSVGIVFESIYKLYDPISRNVQSISERFPGLSDSRAFTKVFKAVANALTAFPVVFKAFPKVFKAFANAMRAFPVAFKYFQIISEHAQTH